MSILLLGDSHINQFQGCGETFGLCGEVLTGDRLVNGYEPVWSRLVEWLGSGQPGSAMVVSLNEVDIRAHYWRHIPRGDNPHEYVRARVHAFYHRLLELRKLGNLERIVLWGAPPACLNITNNPHWPFVGPPATRNRIVDLFNREFAQLCGSGGPVVFATGFYQYMDMESYEPSGHIPSDGVHWAGSLTGEFWNELIAPAVSGVQQAIPSGPDYVFGYSTVRNLDQYDSWIRVDSGSGYEHTAEHLGQCWALVNQADVPAERTELVLVNK
jgi:hypothetical protein